MGEGVSLSWDKRARVLAKRGSVEILAELTKPMRYIDLKEKTGLPDATLTSRINELLELGLIEQKPQRTPSGRYYLAYDIAGGEETRRITQTGFEWAVKQMISEELLEKSHLDAIDALSDLSERQKEIAKEEFVRRFQDIKELINEQCAKAYFEAIAHAKRM